MAANTSIESPVIPQPKFQLGEKVWLAGTPCYLIKPPKPVGTGREEWVAYRNTWGVTDTPIKIVGMHLSEDGEKIYYDFPGKGNDDGTCMFRNREDAVNFAKLKNNAQ